MLKALKEKLSKLLAQSEAVVAAAKDAGRDLTEDETAQIDAYLDESDTLRAEIELAEAKAEADQQRMSRLAAASADLDRVRASKTATTNTDTMHVEVGEPELLNDPKLGWRHVGEQATAIYNAGAPGGYTDERLRIGAAATGMNQSSQSAGGFLVAPAFSQEIWDGLNQEASSLWSMTDQFTIEGDSLTLLANAETDRSTTVWGGARAYWHSEAAQIKSSNPTLREVKLEANELSVLIYATEKVIKNSPQALGQVIDKSARAGIDYKTTDGLINGDGAGKPLGILSSPARITIAKESGQAASTIVKANIDKAWARLHPNSEANAIWIANKTVLPELLKLAVNVGTGGQPVFSRDMKETPGGALYGRPIVYTEHAQALGTEGDLILVDLSAYATGNVGGIDAAVSAHLRFDFRESAFRFTWMGDGQPWLASALTPANGDTLSTMVTIATRS